MLFNHFNYFIMKTFTLGLALLIAGLSTNGQNAPLPVRPLSLGDAVPDLEFKSLINHTGQTARLSDFKGKNIILDFWGTYCTPCVELFPELDGLQKAFKKDLVIIAATWQPREKVEAFLKTNAFAKNVSFLIATDARPLNKLFPNGSIPHEVWISKNRKLQAVTSAEYITHANIEAFTNNKTFPFIHKDDNLSYNYEKSIVENAISINESQVLEKTSFYKHIPGLSASVNLHRSDTGYFLSYLNQPLMQLYFNALPVRLNNFYRQYILEAAPVEDFFYNVDNLTENYDEWRLRNTYCYEVNSRQRLSDSSIKAKMLRDLNDQFNLNGRIEKRCCTLYKLLYIGKGRKALKSSGITTGLEWSDKGLSKNLYNKPVSTLIQFLNGGSTKRTDVFEFEDGTSIGYNIDIELKLLDVGDIENLKTQLKPYGLDLKESQIVKDVFVLGRGEEMD